MADMKRKTSQIHLKVTDKQKKEIRAKSEKAHMSMSDYILSCSLSGERVITVNNAAAILPHLGELSTLVRLIEDENLKKAITKEARCIWQFLNQ